MAARPEHPGTPFDHLVSRKKPLTKTIAVALDPDLAEEYEEAKRTRELAAGRASARPTDGDAQALLWEAEEAVAKLEQRLRDEDAVAWFTFRSIGRAAYDALVDQHQPTAAQKAKANSMGMGAIAWDPESFPPALVAACLVEPKLSAQEMAALWRDDAWSMSELGAMLQAAVDVNGSRRTFELGKDSSTTRSSAPS